MAGTSWPALVAGRKARATDVELKFDWLEGHLHPMSGGTTAHNTYDIGGSTVLAWRNGYFATALYIGGDNIKTWAMALSLLNSD